MESPLGPLTLVAGAEGLERLEWGGGAGPATGALVEAAGELASYFAGALTDFTVPLAPKVSPATARVLEVMRAIPYGDTLTYGEVAVATGLSAQAVGQACGTNPLPIVIPCHRVLGSTGLGGYSGQGGIESKVWLLRHEGAAGLLI